MKSAQSASTLAAIVNVIGLAPLSANSANPMLMPSEAKNLAGSAIAPRSRQARTGSPIHLNDNSHASRRGLA